MRKWWKVTDLSLQEISKIVFHGADTLQFHKLHIIENVYRFTHVK